MVASALVALILFLQVGNPIVQPPPSGNTTMVNNTTNVFPPPDPAVVIETEKQSAPVILQSGLPLAIAAAVLVGAGVLIGQLSRPSTIADHVTVRVIDDGTR